MNDQTPIPSSLVDKLREVEASPELKAERAMQWKAEHAEVIASWNAWVSEHGLPLAKYRKY